LHAIRRSCQSIVQSRRRVQPVMIKFSWAFLCNGTIMELRMGGNHYWKKKMQKMHLQGQKIIATFSWWGTSRTRPTPGRAGLQRPVHLIHLLDAFHNTISFVPISQYLLDIRRIHLIWLARTSVYHHPPTFTFSYIRCSLAQNTLLMQKRKVIGTFLAILECGISISGRRSTAIKWILARPQANPARNAEVWWGWDGGWLNNCWLCFNI